MKLFETENNPLVNFLISFNAKKRNRRKYVEYKLLNYSISQEYDNSIILIRQKVSLSEKELYKNNNYINGSRAYRIIDSHHNSKIILRLFKVYLNKEKKLRKLKIKKLIN